MILFISIYVPKNLIGWCYNSNKILIQFYWFLCYTIFTMITFDEYLQKLNELAEVYPEVRTFKLVHAIDEEGNAFQEVVWLPTIGKLDRFGDFMPLEELDSNEVPNAVCVN